MGDSKLTTKQRLFVEAYLANPNATEAARKAGYKGTDNALGVIGHKMLTNAKIRDLVETRVKGAIITTDEVLNGVKRIALHGQREADKLKAYELLGKYLVLWTDKQENSGTQTVIFKKSGDSSRDTE